MKFHTLSYYLISSLSLFLTLSSSLSCSAENLIPNTHTTVPYDSTPPRRPAKYQISLLTCSEMKDMYASFGHSAIRIKNKLTGEDVVYDYGLFSFQEPYFVWKFLRGKLMYWVGQRNFDRFMYAYQRDGREVKEDILNLTEQQTLNIIHKLNENLKPENKYYRYDFINDNCATRIRDMLITDDVIFNNEASGLTFRNNFDYYLDSRKWMQLGVDLLLGAVADEEMTRSDEMYLPYALSANIAEISFEGKSILQSSKILFPGKKMEPKGSNKLFQPWLVLSACFLLFLSLFFWKKESIAKLRPYLYGLIVLMSALVLFMWFGSSHDATSNNWNILWINPLYILLVFGKKYPWKKKLTIVLSALALSVILLGWLMPQQFNLACFPFIAIILLFNLNYLIPYTSRKIPSNSPSQNKKIKDEALYATLQNPLCL